MDPFLSGWFRLGAGLSQAKVTSNKCLAQPYLDQKVNNKIWKPGGKVVSEKDVSFMCKRQQTREVEISTTQ